MKKNENNKIKNKSKNKYHDHNEEHENSHNFGKVNYQKNNAKNKNDNNIVVNKSKNSDLIFDNNTFTESDIDEFKNIFNQNDLKNNGSNNKSLDSSNLFEASEDNNYKNDEITLKDLDPKIQEVLILFVLSNDYYQLLVKERAKKAFKFNNIKK